MTNQEITTQIDNLHDLVAEVRSRVVQLEKKLNALEERVEQPDWRERR